MQNWHKYDGIPHQFGLHENRHDSIHIHGEFTETSRLDT